MKDLIPKDSFLLDWMKIYGITEVPSPYSLVCGLATIGCVLGRSVYVDQVQWKVFPCLSTFLVGPSGAGKDTSIGISSNILRSVGGVPILSFATFERLVFDMAKLPPPAVAYSAIPEATSVMGKADYSAKLIPGLTDLLSQSDSFAQPLKGDKNTPLVIYEPTLTLQLGSTVEWIHKIMPDNSLEGGFFPRFLICPISFSENTIARKNIPLVKALPKSDVEASVKAKEFIINKLKEIKASFTGSKEILLSEEAQLRYSAWYYNRLKYFPRSIEPYAQRSRDQVLRIAIISCITRGHSTVDEVDIQFGIDILKVLGERIADVVIPKTKEAVVVDSIIKLLPMDSKSIYKELRSRYGARAVGEALVALRSSGEITNSDGLIKKL